ncbi:MAG: ABC transporter permease [Deltaproteobacteria bacterium]|nr:ABC transporter permease [Deltaproteobacteria bacterium]
MTHFLLRRLVAALFLLLIVLSLTFFILQLAPGDPISRFNNPRLTVEQVEHMRRAWGLDRPIHIQYLSWMKRVIFHWDWGISFIHRRPAASVIAQALPLTLLLGTTALVLQYCFGLLLGAFSARRAGSPEDAVVRLSSLVVYSIPNFWLALMAILVFHIRWNIFPGSGSGSIGAETLDFLPRTLDRLHHLALPALVLAISSAAGISRFVRNSLLDVLKQDYIQTARSTGASQDRVLWVHALRNTVVPLAQLVGLSLPTMLNGVLMIEVVFGWPGLGFAIFQACLSRDYPMILAGTAYGAVLVICGSLLADLLHRWADPRLRVEA